MGSLGSESLSLLHHPLLMGSLLLQDIRVASAHVLYVYNILVFFVVVVVVTDEVVHVSLFSTHHITAAIAIVIFSFVFWESQFAGDRHTVAGGLSAGGLDSLMFFEVLQVLEVLPTEAFAGAARRRSLFAPRVSVGLELRDCKLCRQVEALVSALILLREELLTMVIEVL